jgi:hypothetical protein
MHGCARHFQRSIQTRNEIAIMMYVVGCDLRQDGDWVAIGAAVARLGDARRCLETAWLLSSERSAPVIQEYLSDYLADGDKILVIACDRIASWAGFDAEFSDWLNSRL